MSGDDKEIAFTILINHYKQEFFPDATEHKKSRSSSASLNKCLCGKD